MIDDEKNFDTLRINLNKDIDYLEVMRKAAEQKDLIGVMTSYVKLLGALYALSTPGVLEAYATGSNFYLAK